MSDRAEGRGTNACMSEDMNLRDDVLQEGHHALHVRLLPGRQRKEAELEESPTAQLHNSFSHHLCPYVTACARTRTPPAQRLGLRGESDAIVSPCVWSPTTPG